jgi:hypothetical protein
MGAAVAIDALGWLKWPQVNARMRGRRGLRNRARAHENREKIRIRREKDAAKILVNGSNIARVHQESEFQVARKAFATASKPAPMAQFLK